MLLFLVATSLALQSVADTSPFRALPLQDRKSVV